MRLRIPIALALLVALADRAAAAPDPHVTAALAQLAAQGQALAKGDADRFRATFTADARVAWDGGTPSAKPDDAEAWWRDGYYSPERFAIKKSQVAWFGTWGVLAAEVRITQRGYAEPAGAGDPDPQPETNTYHWLAVVIADGANVKTRVLQVARVRRDKDLGSADTDPAAAPAGTVAPLVAQPKLLLAQLASDPNVAVFGTSEAERGLGAAAAKKLLGAWQHLDLIQIGDTGEVVDGDLAFAFAHVGLKLKGQQHRTELQGLVIAHKVASTWQVVGVGFAAGGW